MPGANTGPDDHLEDVVEAFCQMADNYKIIIATVGKIKLLVVLFN
jgi:hypothetical protein